MRKTIQYLLAAAMLLPGTIAAQSRSTIDISTDIAMFVPVAIGAGVALAKDDYTGLLQLGKSMAAGVAVSYAMK